MNFLGPLLGLLILCFSVLLIIRKANPYAVLLFSGLLMLLLAWCLELNVPVVKKTTGSQLLDFFRLIKEAFASGLKRDSNLLANAWLIPMIFIRPLKASLVISSRLPWYSIVVSLMRLISVLNQV